MQEIKKTNGGYSMPENIRATSDENLIAFVKNIARSYGEMGLLAKKLTTQVVSMTNNVDAVNRVISQGGQLDPDSKKVFGNYFVGENLEHLDMATRAPAILAAAYEYISEHRDDSDEMRARFERISAHVDTLSANFANTGGMVVNDDEWPLVDTNNIADAYEGLLRTFAARRADVERAGNAEKVAEYNGNLDQLKTAPLSLLPVVIKVMLLLPMISIFVLVSFSLSFRIFVLKF